MVIDDFGVQVLYAVYRYRVSDLYEFEPEIFDNDIWDVGQTIFGDGWGGNKRNTANQSYEYCPAVAMKLGRLAQAGLVNKIPIVGEDYCEWELTNAGYTCLIERYLITVEEIPKNNKH